MEKLLTGSEQNAFLDELLRAARSDAVSFARQASALVALNNLSGREEAELSRLRQFPALELAGTLRMGQQALSARCWEAERLVGHLPFTHAACLSGQLLVGQAKVLLEVTKNASALVAHRVELRLLPAAIGWSTADLRRKATLALTQVESELDLELGTDQVAQRLAAARANRKVTIRPDTDGMAFLGALLPADKAVAFGLQLDELARRAKLIDADSGIVRTADQRRADLLADLPGLVLRGGCEERSQGTGFTVVLNVTVPMDTVLDRGVQPGVLEGFGPISAEHVRLLRPTASVRAIYVDSGSGRPISLGRTMIPPTADEAMFRAALQDLVGPVQVTDTAEPQHDPSAGLTRLVRIRDVRCAGPGCSVPARRCDRDHHVPYDHAVTAKRPGRQRGPTAAWNLICLSERCHQAKHHGWALTRHSDGSVTWRSPLGRTYDKPSPHERPQPTDWPRFQGSPRWDATGLRLIPAPTQPDQPGAPSKGDQDADWDWASSRSLTDPSGVDPVEPAASDPPPF